MTKQSNLEALFESQLAGADITGYKKELRFIPDRQWKFDFAWPEQKFAVELEGAVHANGRHTRGVGFEEDCHKYNVATLLGWKVFRMTRKHVETGVAFAFVKKMLGK